jgi:hypothetical protein
MYRIKTVTDKAEILSPLVFEKDEAIDRCETMNLQYPKGFHVPVFVEKFKEEEVYDPKRGLETLLIFLGMREAPGTLKWIPLDE